MTLFLRELARNRKSFMIWLLSLVVLNIMMMALYPSVADQAETYDKLMKAFPKELAAAFNMDRLSLSDLLGYYGTEAYMMITLFGSMFAMLLGAGILSKEENDKTIEFLLAKPLTRNRIVTSKVCCVLFYVVLFNVLYTLTNFIMFEIVKQKAYDFTAFLVISLGPLLLHLTFAAIGLLISIFIVKTKSVFPVSLGIILALFFVGIASSLSEKTQNLKYISLFKYVDSGDLILNKRIDGVYLVIMLVVVMACTGMTYVLYNRKNITV